VKLPQTLAEKGAISQDLILGSQPSLRDSRGVFRNQLLARVGCIMEQLGQIQWK
jgi:hypothetical protein